MGPLISLRTALFRLRHLVGLTAAVCVAWAPMARGFSAYQPLADHGECGFLCMFLIAALFWWLVGIVKGAGIWIIIVLLLRQLRVRQNADCKTPAASP